MNRTKLLARFNETFPVGPEHPDGLMECFVCHPDGSYARDLKLEEMDNVGQPTLHLKALDREYVRGETPKGAIVILPPKAIGLMRQTIELAEAGTFDPASLGFVGQRASKPIADLLAIALGRQPTKQEIDDVFNV